MQVFQDDIGFTEGPVVGRDGAVYATAIDRGEIARVKDGVKSVFAVTGGGPNGLVEGKDAFYLAQNGGQWPATSEIKRAPGVQKITLDGQVSTLVADPRMKAPNDLAFGPDGFLYVTDPTRKPERDDGRIWRVNVETGEAELLLQLGWYPNGIGFGLEDDLIYIADTGNKRIVRMALKAPRAEQAETFLTMPRGMPDGFAFDSEGKLVIAAVGVQEDEPGTVQVWSRQGKLEETLEIGLSRFITNVAISPDRKLYVCESGGKQLLVRAWPTAGLPLHPLR